jgi:hypothetical protein
VACREFAATKLNGFEIYSKQRALRIVQELLGTRALHSFQAACSAACLVGAAP